MLVATLAFATAAAMHAVRDPAVDTLRVRAAASTPALDGRASVAEYGEPTLRISRGEGAAPIDVWIVRSGATVTIAAAMPDTTHYWGDDLVVALDPHGDAGARPGDGDLRWYLRRVADSSVVSRAAGGRWERAGGDPTVGARREGEGGRFAIGDGAGAWSAELQLDAALFAGRDGRRPRIAIRSFDDRPAPTWRTWPAPPEGTRPTRVELTPDLWVPVVLAP